MKSINYIVIALFSLFINNLFAQNSESLTINVATAGTLPSLIPSSSKFQIKNLTLTGYLNGTDILYIREMAGRQLSSQITEGKLSTLDLSGSNIVKGGC